MINPFRRWLKPAPQRVEKSDTTGMTFEQFFSRTGSWESPVWGGAQEYMPSAREQEGAYKTHPIVRAAIDIIAGTTPVPRLEVGGYKDGTWDALKGHPAIDLLNAPNPYQGLFEFLVELTTKAYAGGVGYVWKLRNQGGSKIVELRVLPASWVTPIRPLQGLNLVDYYQVQGQGVTILPEDMIEFRFPAVGDMCGSVGPLASAWTEIRSDLERSQMISEVIHNIEPPGTAIQSDIGNKPKQAQDAMLRALENRCGRGKRGSSFIIGKEDAMIPFGGLPDLDLPGLMASSESRICAALGVPPLLIQSRIGLEKATYSNAEQMTKNFYQTTMARYWKQLASVLTRGLLQDQRVSAGRGGDRIEFQFAYEELPEFREDANSEATRLVSLAQNQIVTLGEVREELGFPPIAEVLKGEDANTAAMQTDEGANASEEAQEAAPETQGSGGAPASGAAADTEVQQTALNGAQVASLLQIAQSVADGTLTPESALPIMQIAFPASDPNKLREIVANIKVKEPAPEPNPQQQPPQFQQQKPPEKQQKPEQPPAKGEDPNAA